jgi:hypothetical protein
MKHIGLITLTLVVGLITTSATSAQKYFKILDATSVSWSGGMPQTGSGATYTVRAVLTTDEKVTFKDFWLGKEYAIPEVASVSYSDGRALKKGDTLLVKYTEHHYPANSPMAQMADPINKPDPI